MMANKAKKISINALEEAVKAVAAHDEVVEWNGLEITIKPVIGIKEMLMFVSDVAKSCFADDDGEYMPEVRDFAIKSCLIDYYTNLALPSNTEKRYELIYACNITEVIMEHIDKGQLFEIIKAIDARIEHTASANVEALNKQMNELYDAFNSLQTNLGDIFSGIGADDIKGLVSALSGGGLDESKIVEAYLTQTAKKDTDK